MGKHHSVFCQFVDMWRLDTIATVGIECFNPKIVSEDQDNVRSVAIQTPG